MTMTNDLNKPVRSYDGGDDYNEIICFGFDKKTNEFSNYTDLYVTAEIIEFEEDYLTANQIDEVQIFAEKIQLEIRDWLRMCQDIEETEKWLINN